MPHLGAVGEQQIRGSTTDIAHGYVNTGQRGDEFGGDRHVVVADNGHVIGDTQSTTADLAHGADGQLIVGAEQRRRPRLRPQERRGPDRPGISRVPVPPTDRLDLRKDPGGFESSIRERRQHAIAAVDGLPDRQRPVDEADAPMAEIDQMGDGGARARDVVAGDGGQARGDRRVIHENHSDSAPGQHREIVERTARGRHDDAAHVQSRQQAHELALAIGIGIGRAQHGDPVVLAQAVLNAAGGLGEEGVGDVVDEHPDQRGAPMAQTPGGLRAHEAELVDRRAHPVQGWSGHALGVVEDVRDRADRDAGPLSDVAHRRMSHGTPPHHAP